MDSQRQTPTLSRRMRAVADLVDAGDHVVDVGTDHGYIPIYLIKAGIARHVIALDVKEGPLLRARRHVRDFGCEEEIEVRFSDGLKNVSAQEADTAILSGMGGPLIEKILTDGAEVAGQMKCLILQPQSEVADVRKFLVQHGFSIRKEDMVEEDHKFYFLMKAVPGKSESYADYEYTYGKQLLKERHPVLKDYLVWEQNMLSRIEKELPEEPESDRLRSRRAQLKEERAQNRKALVLFEEEERSTDHAGK